MTFIIIRTSEPEFRLKEHLVLGRREDLYQLGEINVGSRLIYMCPVNRGSSVSIVSGYGRSRFDPRQRRKDFSFSLYVQTSSGAHPTSCRVGTRGPFPGTKARPGRDADHSSHLVQRSKMSGSYTLYPPKHLHGV
jgi:hypothetical protein